MRGGVCISARTSHTHSPFTYVYIYTRSYYAHVYLHAYIRNTNMYVHGRTYAFVLDAAFEIKTSPEKTRR